MIVCFLGFHASAKSYMESFELQFVILHKKDAQYSQHGVVQLPMQWNYFPLLVT